MSTSLKIWAWFKLGHTQFMKSHLESPLLKFFEITPEAGYVFPFALFRKSDSHFMNAKFCVVHEC